MAEKKFVVSTSHQESQPISISFVILSIGGPLIAAATMSLRVAAMEYRFSVVIVSCLLIFLLFKVNRKKISQSSCEVLVTVYPTGVQLVRLNSSRPVNPPLFIPRDLILDVIVNEVILAHKVVSIVLFRVLKHQDSSKVGVNYDSKHQISLLLKERCIHLIPAFPGVEMSFVDCHLMRRELSAALGLV